MKKKDLIPEATIKEKQIVLKAVDPDADLPHGSGSQSKSKPSLKNVEDQWDHCLMNMKKLLKEMPPSVAENVSSLSLSLMSGVNAACQSRKSSPLKGLDEELATIARVIGIKVFTKFSKKKSGSHSSL